MISKQSPKHSSGQFQKSLRLAHILWCRMLTYYIWRPVNIRMKLWSSSRTWRLARIYILIFNLMIRLVGGQLRIPLSWTGVARPIIKLVTGYSSGGDDLVRPWIRMWPQIIYACVSRPGFGVLVDFKQLNPNSTCAVLKSKLNI